jgi:hypothetical protein
VAEMVRKLKLLVEGVPAFEEQQPAINVFTSFAALTQEQIPYEIFRKGVVSLLRQMEADFFRERLTMSEDDIRALYSILDSGGEGKLLKEQLNLLHNEPEMAKRITKFYEARINKRMVKVKSIICRTHSSNWAKIPIAFKSIRSKMPQFCSSGQLKTDCLNLSGGNAYDQNSRTLDRSKAEPSSHRPGKKIVRIKVRWELTSERVNPLCSASGRRSSV